MNPFAFVEADGLKIRYRREGSGPSVLLLHGWGGSIESFEPVYQALRTSFDAVAIDFPGHGQSTLPPRPWHVADFLDITLEVMDQLAMTQPHIVAHSFGARVSIQMAARHRQRAAKMLFAAGAGVAPRKSISRSLKRKASSIAHTMEAVPVARSLVHALRGRLLPRLASRDYRNAGELRQTLSNVIAEDLTPLLSSIRSKCLLVWGDQDQETPLYMGETMHRLIPASELVIFPGAGHFPYLDQSNKFNLLMMRFLREP